MLKRTAFFCLVFWSWISLTPECSLAQNWNPSESAEKQIMVEGRRYLFNHVFKVTSVGIDTLQTKLIWNDNNASDGLMLMIESYVYNSKKGVVLTSWHESAVFYSEEKRNYVKDKYVTESNQFSVTHIKSEEFSRINDIVLEIKNAVKSTSIHRSFLRKVNDSITIEFITNDKEGSEVALWIDGFTRHNMTFNQWQAVFAEHTENTQTR